MGAYHVHTELIRSEPIFSKGDLAEVVADAWLEGYHHVCVVCAAVIDLEH